MMTDLPPLLGEAACFTRFLAEVSAAARLDRPVLVIGERGTGKELIAARLHYLSPRWDRAFIKLNCAALAPELLESELFGHEAGAFTGAVKRRAGRFERADGGSLFLDEIATASLSVQEKLLRVIEYGEYERLGGEGSRRVDVRVIAATNVDLPAEVAAGRFRADLLDRLAFEVLTVPPLRARAEDIPRLARHFAQAMARELDRPAPEFTDQALAALAAHDWPGNVRELKNTIDRTVYRAGSDQPIDEIRFDPFASPWRPGGAPVGSGVVAPAAPPPAPLAPAEATALPIDLKATVATFEKHWLEQALITHQHHQGRAAEALGLSYDQLRHLLRKHGLAQSGDSGVSGRPRS